jgi:putative ABC transport system substrate-binding protein
MNVSAIFGRVVLGIILILTLFTVPVSSFGQQSARVYRIGWFTGDRSETDPRVCLRTVSPFRQAWNEAMRERGYIEGQNLTLECRRTDGKNERAPAFAAELVNLKVDLIIAAYTNQVRALKDLTTTIPIVMYGVIDPVRRGLVASLARPGGNITGLTDDAGLELLGKYLELLKQAVPTASRVAALRNQGATGDPPLLWGSRLEAEARALGVTLQSYQIRQPEELEGVFAAMTKARAEAFLVVPSPFFAIHRQRIVNLAAQTRMPAMYPDRPDVQAGGLMAYAVDDLETARRLAAYVDRILKGAKPSELPVEQPSKFELILNLKTARALGLTIPPTLLLQADKVIE